ncbi:LptA/OstA family protein [Leptotrichia sp. HSP-334]|uniref:LptA/OstA family protein n=1 Tax=Leptotrichia rugosa TaxID=3239302 RepID=A0AB39VJL2_9FUSO
MWKKIIYGVLLLILIYFIYTVFFKKIPAPLDQMQKDMKAKKVIYRLKDEVIVYADEQIGSEGDEVVKFKKVIIDLVKKKMLISGKEGEVNTKTYDAILKGKVVGATKDKKWEIYTERADYKKQGDKLISPVRTKLVNNVDKTVSESDKVETTTTFQDIVATGHVSYVNNKDKKKITTDKMTYNDPTKVSIAEGHVVYTEEKTKRTLTADKMRYDQINQIGNAEGNVHYKDPENKLDAQKADYYMKDDENERVEGFGNVVYTGKESVVKADTAVYFIKKKQINGNGHVVYIGKESVVTADSAVYLVDKKQVDGRGHVVYTGKTMIITGDHVFYDKVAQIINGDGNGTYNYLPRKTTGTYRSGVYNLKARTMTTNDYYTVNYDDYKMDGTGLVYSFATGDATMNGPFNVRKQNFTVHGENGTMNTISKDIYANKMVMTSVQGDRISADKGQGSFEKKEFRFDGHVTGKIRGNVKDLANDPRPLVESEAVHFRGNTAKVYFVKHKKGNNMSITRTEIKQNVHMTYKDITLDSQYNEMDSLRNLILARDKVMVDFKNSTKMTSNYLYMDMNKQEGYARNNVKIVSTLPQFKTINTSADKAIIYLKDKKIRLNGNVVTYQGKTIISSKEATYDIRNRVLENYGNIQMQYELNNGGFEQNKSDPKNVAAVQEVINKLSFNEENGRAVLPKAMTASNGVPVSIKWKSSNSALMSVTGKVNKSFYGGKTQEVAINAKAKAGTDTAEKNFNKSVSSESTKEMLTRAADNIYFPENGENLPSTVKINVHKKAIDVPVKWSKNGKKHTATLDYDGVQYEKDFEKEE